MHLPSDKHVLKALHTYESFHKWLLAAHLRLVRETCDICTTDSEISHESQQRLTNCL